MLKSPPTLIDLEKLVNPQATDPCGTCGGSRRCYPCDGTGYIGPSKCGACGGTGKCNTCDGKGKY